MHSRQSQVLPARIIQTLVNHSTLVSYTLLSYHCHRQKTYLLRMMIMNAVTLFMLIIMKLERYVKIV